jgi:LuxR family transcriptional regulator, maltose regulon positive regulatory protein
MRITINRTKLRPPSRRGRLVERPALLQRLGTQPRPRLALIQAPAGFGKSSLLSQHYHCLRACDAAAVWLSIDAGDNNCDRFLQHLVAALEPLGIAFDANVKEALCSGGRLPPTTACDLLSNALADMEKDVVVCIDDAHILTDRSVGQLLASLMQAPSSRMSWVLATRVTPTQLPLSRLRLLGELCEIGARELKFSDRESQEFFATTAGVPLERSLAARLNERAEGWVAGLQLASLRIKGGEAAAAVLERFSGINRTVAEFLDAEVLARLDESTVSFLLDASILTRMCTELCNHVTGRTDARARLDALEAAQLFLFSLDDERTWYRFHHLFAAFLEQRLREFYPERARMLHERASVWLEQNGCAIEAIEHALRARSFLRAARLLDSLNLYENGQIALQERLALQIPLPVLEQFPNLQLERIWGWEADWDFAKSRTALQRMRRVLHDWRTAKTPVPQGVDIDYIAAKHAHREMMVCLVSDDMAATRKLCERWLAAGHPTDRHMEVSTSGALMAARREHYRCDGAAATAAALHEAYQRAQFDFGGIFQDCISGLTFFMRGETDAARQVYERALAGAIAMHGRRSPLASMPALLLAEIHYEHNDLREARSLVEDHLEVAYGLGYVDKLIAGYLTRSRLEVLDARHEAACRTLEDAERQASAAGFERLQAHVLAERLRQLSLLGKKEEAVELARGNDLLGSSTRFQPHESVTTRNELLALAWSRAAVCLGELDGPIRLLKNWYRFALERGCYRSSVRLAVELAAVLHERNDLSAACRHLSEALRQGLRGRFMRTFMDAGPRVHEVLAAVLNGAASLREAERGYAAELLRAFESERRWVMPASTPEAVAPQAQLNPRELDILELAAGAVPNREIARRLALSENTVKWYWKRIFGKLCVRRRLQAINTARAAGVIF